MSNIQTDMNIVANLLRKQRICNDISPISNAIAKSKKDGVYNVEKLQLSVNIVPRETRPNVKVLSIIFDNLVRYQNNVVNWDNYCFRIVIKGNNEIGTYKSAWHLDYDIKEHEYMHPCFHFTFGGEKIDDVNSGGLLIMTTPRIVHPPLDFVLGIDFVLSNFFKKEEYTIIKSNPLYRAAVKHSQDRLWKPFVCSVCNSINQSNHPLDNYFSAQQLIPTIVC